MLTVLLLKSIQIRASSHRQYPGALSSQIWEQVWGSGQLQVETLIHYKVGSALRTNIVGPVHWRTIGGSF